MLGEAGIKVNRVRIESISAGEGEKFAQIISDFKSELAKLGPIKPGEFTEPSAIKEGKKKKKAKLNEI